MPILEVNGVNLVVQFGELKEANDARCLNRIDHTLVHLRCILQVNHCQLATVLRFERGPVAALVLDRHHADEEHRLIVHAQVVNERAVFGHDET